MNKKNAVQSYRTLTLRNLKISQDKGYACVYLNRQKVMLGARYGTPEADDAFRKLQIQVLTDPTLSFLTPELVLVDHLCCAYLKYAEEHDPGHYSAIKTAIEILLQHFTGQPVDSLDSRSFLFLQDQFVAYGVSRKYCNSLMNYVRAMLKWGAIRKLVSSLVHRAIKRSIATANKRLPENERIPTWTPYQLRHAAITDIALQTKSLDTARAAAGQKSISVTQGYNHADVKIAIEQAVKRSR